MCHFNKKMNFMFQNINHVIICSNVNLFNPDIEDQDLTKKTNHVWQAKRKKERKGGLELEYTSQWKVMG